MIRLPEPNTTFKDFEGDEFLKAHNGGENLLDNFLIEPSNDSVNSSQI
jgi:hypothetical protein